MTAITQGVEHVGLTVLNVRETADFLINSLGFTLLGEKPSYPAIFLTDGVTKITLWQVASNVPAVPFNRKNNIGLHHLAFKIPDDAELDNLYNKLKAISNIVIEFAPELMGQGPSRHMMIYEPGGLRIEFIHRK